MNSFSLLAALQAYLQKQSVALDTLGPAAIVKVMVAWFREVPIIDAGLSADALVYRYGGWSEGCATGFKLSVMRRVTERAAAGGETEWIAGITMLFEPSRFARAAPPGSLNHAVPPKRTNRDAAPRQPARLRRFAPDRFPGRHFWSRCLPACGQPRLRDCCRCARHCAL